MAEKLSEAMRLKNAFAAYDTALIEAANRLRAAARAVQGMMHEGEVSETASTFDRWADEAEAAHNALIDALHGKTPA